MMCLILGCWWIFRGVFCWFDALQDRILLEENYKMLKAVEEIKPKIDKER